MKKHCSYIGRDCIATPGCAARECQAALAFPFGCGGEPSSGGVTGHDDELIAAVRTLRGLGYTYHGDEQWKPGPSGLPEWGDREIPMPPLVEVDALGNILGITSFVGDAIRTLIDILGYRFVAGRWTPALTAPTPQCLTTAPPESPAYALQMDRVQPPSPIPFETEAAWLRHEHGPAPTHCEHKHQKWSIDMQRGHCADCGAGLLVDGVVVT